MSAIVANLPKKEKDSQIITILQKHILGLQLRVKTLETLLLNLGGVLKQVNTKVIDDYNKSLEPIPALDIELPQSEKASKTEKIKQEPTKNQKS
jgi:hypothetical protein